jgi:hypothetical protein
MPNNSFYSIPLKGKQDAFQNVTKVPTLKTSYQQLINIFQKIAVLPDKYYSHQLN